MPGAVTKDGPTAAGFVAPLIRNGAPVCVDSIGIGSSALDFIKGLGLLTFPVVGSAGSGLMDKAGQLRFRNKRAEMYWRLREALDPAADESIALPPDQELAGRPGRRALQGGDAWARWPPSRSATRTRSARRLGAPRQGRRRGHDVCGRHTAARIPATWLCRATRARLATVRTTP